MASRNRQLLGIVLVVIGVGLGIWGYQIAGSFGSQVTETLTGAADDKVMMLYVGAAACVVAGAWLLIRR